jgi:hypothetical protein
MSKLLANLLTSVSSNGISSSNHGETTINKLTATNFLADLKQLLEITSSSELDEQTAGKEIMFYLQNIERET